MEGTYQEGNIVKFYESEGPWDDEKYLLYSRKVFEVYKMLGEKFCYYQIDAHVLDFSTISESRVRCIKTVPLQYSSSYFEQETVDSFFYEMYYIDEFHKEIFDGGLADHQHIETEPLTNGYFVTTGSPDAS